MNEEILKQIYENGSKYYRLPDFETFKNDMKDEKMASEYRKNMAKYYSMPDENEFFHDIGLKKKFDPQSFGDSRKLFSDLQEKGVTPSQAPAQGAVNQPDLTMSRDWRERTQARIKQNREQKEKEDKAKTKAVLKSIADETLALTPEQLQDPSVIDQVFESYVTKAGEREAIEYKRSQAQREELQSAIPNVEESFNTGDFKSYLKGQAQQPVAADENRKTEDKFIKQQLNVSGKADRVNERDPEFQQAPKTRTTKDTPTNLELEEYKTRVAQTVAGSLIKELEGNESLQAKLSIIGDYNTQLSQLKTKIDTNPNDVESIEKYNFLADQYNQTIEDEDVQKYAKAGALIDNVYRKTEDYIKEFPMSYQERVRKQVEQDKINALFDSEAQSMGRGAASALYGIRHIPRAATKFVGEVAKLVTHLDFDNEYGKMDAMRDWISGSVDSFNDMVMPLPDQVDKAPLVYYDDKGEMQVDGAMFLPTLFKTGADMAMLLYGAGKIGSGIKALSKASKFVQVADKTADIAGLYTSTFVQTFDDYYQAAMETNKLSPNEAKAVAFIQSGTEALIETFNPQAYLFSSTIRKGITQQVVRDILNGTAKKEAIKSAFYTTFKEIGKEQMEEYLQSGKDFLVQASVNRLKDQDAYDNNYKDLLLDIVTSTIVTPFVAGIPAVGAGISQNANRHALYNDAIKMVAADKQTLMPILKQKMVEAGATPEQVATVLRDINQREAKTAGRAYYAVNDEEVTKEEIAKRIEERKFDGIEILNDEETAKLYHESWKEHDATRPKMAMPARAKVAADSKSIDQFVEGAKKIQPENAQRMERLGKTFKAVSAVLSKIVPNLGFMVHRDNDAAVQWMKENNKQVNDGDQFHGFYSDGKIHIVANQYNDSTPLHEAVHPIINALRETNPDLYGRLINQSLDMPFIKSAEDGTPVSFRQYVDQTYPDLAKESDEEKMVMFIEDFLDNNIDYDRLGESRDSVMQKIKDMVEQFMVAIGFKDKLDLNKAEDLRDALKMMTKAFREGKAIKVSSNSDVVNDAVSDVVNDGVQASKSDSVVGLNYTDGDEGLYSDEYVSGEIRIVDNDVEILDWNSKYKIKGGTELSLKRLKKAYKGEIRAVDTGYKNEPSFQYWNKMMEKGLIDGFYDDDGVFYEKVQASRRKSKANNVKVATQEINEEVATEVERIALLPVNSEDGSTFNTEGTRYTGGGIVLPVVSDNYVSPYLPTTKENPKYFTPDAVVDFINSNRDKIMDDSFKVGFYKFPGKNQISADLNIIVPESQKDLAIEIGRYAGQKSLFNLADFSYIETGADGSNPKEFTNEELRQISDSLKNGELPGFVQASKLRIDVSQAERIAKETEDLVVPGKRQFTYLPGTAESSPSFITIDDVIKAQPVMLINRMVEFTNGKKEHKGKTTKIKLATFAYGVRLPKDKPTVQWARKAFDVYADNIKNNIITVYKAMPESIRDISKLWYDGANVLANKMSEKYKISLEQAAASIAALSPQKPWFDNLHIAQFAVDYYFNNQEDILTPDVVGFFEKNMYHKEKGKIKVYGKQLKYLPKLKKSIGKKFKDLNDYDKGIMVRYAFETFYDRRPDIRIPTGHLSGEKQSAMASYSSYDTTASVMSILKDGSDENISKNIGSKGKVRSFNNNISDPTNASDVTIDTHAEAAGSLMPLSAEDAMFDVASNLLYAEGYRRAAKELGLKAREVQSITWEGIRVIFPDTIKTKAFKDKINDLWDSVKKRKLSPEEAIKKAIEYGKEPSNTEWIGFFEQNPENYGKFGYLRELSLAGGNTKTTGSRDSRVSGSKVPSMGEGSVQSNRTQGGGVVQPSKLQYNPRTESDIFYWSGMSKELEDRNLAARKEKYAAQNKIMQEKASSFANGRGLDKAANDLIKINSPESNVVSDFIGAEQANIRAKQFDTKTDDGRLKSKEQYDLKERLINRIYNQYKNNNWDVKYEPSSIGGIKHTLFFTLPGTDIQLSYHGNFDSIENEIVELPNGKWDGIPGATFHKLEEATLGIIGEENADKTNWRNGIGVQLKQEKFTPTEEQKQKAKDLFDSYVNNNPDGDVDGLKEFVSQQPVQASKQRQKLNKTAQRIALDESTIYKEIQKEVLSNPQRYMYTPQDLKNKKMDFQNATDADIISNVANNDKLLAAIDFDNNFGVLAAIELINRYTAAGVDTKPVFDKIRALGTTVGQLLRQFAELKTATPEGIMKIVEKAMESRGAKLTKQQADDLQVIARDFIKKRAQLGEAQNNFQQTGSEQDLKKVQDKQKELDKSFNDLHRYVAKVTPFGMDRLLSTILQGNLLKTTSIGANIVGNVLYLPVRKFELIAGDVGGYLLAKKNGYMPIDPISTFVGAEIAGTREFWRTMPAVFMNALKGNMNDSTNKTFEIGRGLHPFTALWQVFTPAGRATLPTKRGVIEKIDPVTGKVTRSYRSPLDRIKPGIYAEKLLEGTIGVNAELMFRLLYLGDAPFKNSARTAAAYRVYARTGGKKAHGSFEKFLAKPDKERDVYTEQKAMEATFSDDRTLAKIADSGIKTLHRMKAHALEATTPGIIRESLNIMFSLLIKASIPFSRVPANLTQAMIELTMPLIPLAAGIRYSKSNPEKGAILIGRAALGMSFIYLTDMLINGGAIIAGGEGDKDEERQAKFETAKPNTINIDAAYRILTGTQDVNNPAKEGDRYVEYSKLGVLGVAMVSRAKFRENVKDKGEDYNDMLFHTKAIEQINSAARGMLELSFLQGTSAFIEAIKDKGMENYFAELSNTLMNIPLPNNITSFTMANREYMLRAKDKDFAQNFIEKQSVKIYPALKDNVPGVYPVISMWGNPTIQNEPESAYTKDMSPWVRQFFDITKSGTIQDPLTVELWNLSSRTNEFPVKAPGKKINLFSDTDEIESVDGYELDEGDYVQAQMISGQIKRMSIMEEVTSEEWSEYTDNEKVKILSNLSNRANKHALRTIKGRIAEMIEEGKIVLDKKNKKYSYLQVRTPDLSEFQKIVEENK